MGCHRVFFEFSVNEIRVFFFLLLCFFANGLHALKATTQSLNGHQENSIQESLESVVMSQGMRTLLILLHCVGLHVACC